MKPFKSSRTIACIEKYEKLLIEANIPYERGMDLPHHPQDHLLSVDESDYSRAMKVLYPNRDTPYMSETEGYNYIVVNKNKRGKITKKDSRYMDRAAQIAGCCLDYRTMENARNAAERCNNHAGEQIYKAVKVSD